MPFLFKDYTDLVLKAYKEKRDANLLSRLLMHLTNANIKQECLNVYNDRINKGEKEEEDILRAFFGVPMAGKNYGYVIERFSPDRFRPLQSFIKGEIKNPALITVELLAWLIDFKPRPLAYAQRIFANSVQIKNSPDKGTDIRLPGVSEDSFPVELGQADIVINKITNDQVKGNPVKKKQKGNIKIAIGFFLVLAILYATVYITQRQKPVGTFYGNTINGCMYWANDHYEQLPCNEESNGRLILPMDKEKMKRFRKITQEDTISERSIGKVHYIKDKGIKFYTEGGNYPEDIKRNLKPLSRYIFDKYLREKSASTKDSLGNQSNKFNRK